MIFRLGFEGISIYFVNMQDFVKEKTLDLILKINIYASLTESYSTGFLFFSNGQNNHILPS